LRPTGAGPRIALSAFQLVDFVLEFLDLMLKGADTSVQGRAGGTFVVSIPRFT
jgi:hypothetical protein